MQPSLRRAALTILLLLSAAAFAQGQTVEVGLVVDPGGLHDALRTRLLEEVRVLTEGEFDVRFSPQYAVATDGSLAGARRGLEALYGARAVDVVIAAGPIASQAAAALARAGALPKPTIAPAILHAGVQGVPLQGQGSGVDNFTYIAYPADVEADLRVFVQVVPATHVAFVLPENVVAAIPGLPAHYRAAAAAAGLQATVAAAPPRVDAILAAVPASADAVFLAYPLGVDEAGLATLAAGLIERGLPSFVAFGVQPVTAGLLVGLHADDDGGRVARRIALNLQRLLLGEAAAAIPVFLQRDERLTINVATARALGLSPSWSILTEAEVVGDAGEPAARQLRLGQAVREAVAANLELAAARQGVAAGRQRLREARARLLPQVTSSATGAVVDEALASPLQAQRSLDAGVQVEQTLYAEPAWAAWAAQQHLQRALEAELEGLRIEVAQDAAVAYLNVLQAMTSERVQRQNLERTRSHLELARVRREIGLSGPAEVFRWESQIATARIGAIDANAARNQAEIGLNRVLHRPLEEAFEARETGLFDEDLVTHDRRFLRFLANKDAFRDFRDFMTVEALAASPQLARLDAALAAAERSMVSAGRARWLPTVGLRAEASRHLLRDGAASQLPAAGGDATWSVGASAVLPLYSGGSRFAAATRAAREAEELRLQRDAAAEAVEARMRASLHAAGASYAGIALSEDAAVAAARNLELVEDAYGRGALAILDLLDAQNAAILAEEGAANAVYDFLVDLMEVERALGKLYLFADDARREAWFERATAYIDHGRRD